MNVVPNEKGHAAGLGPEVGHKNFIQVREVQRVAAASGFELVKAWYTPLHLLSEAFAHNKLVTLCRAVCVAPSMVVFAVRVNETERSLSQ
jgi:hypothetical protein